MRAVLAFDDMWCGLTVQEVAMQSLHCAIITGMTTTISNHGDISVELLQISPFHIKRQHVPPHII